MRIIDLDNPAYGQGLHRTRSLDSLQNFGYENQSDPDQVNSYGRPLTPPGRSSTMEYPSAVIYTEPPAYTPLAPAQPQATRYVIRQPAQQQPMYVQQPQQQATYVQQPQQQAAYVQQPQQPMYVQQPKQQAAYVQQPKQQASYVQQPQQQQPTYAQQPRQQPTYAQQQPSYLPQPQQPSYMQQQPFDQPPAFTMPDQPSIVIGANQALPSFRNASQTLPSFQSAPINNPVLKRPQPLLRNFTPLLPPPKPPLIPKKPPLAPLPGLPGLPPMAPLPPIIEPEVDPYTHYMPYGNIFDHETKKLRKANKVLIVVIAVMSFILLAGVGALIYVVLNGGRELTIPKKETITMQFTVTRVDLTFGVELENPNSYSFYKMEQNFADMVDTYLKGLFVPLETNAISFTGDGGVTGVIQIVVEILSGKSASQTFDQIGLTITAKSEADPSALTIDESSISLVNQVAGSGAVSVSSVQIPLMLLFLWLMRKLT